MQQAAQKKWLVFWLCFVTACTGVLFVNGALLDLDAYVSFAINDADDNPLGDGAVVYIIGSTDANNDGMQEWIDGPPASLIANSTQGDDVFLGSVRIGDNATNAGTFFTTLQYDPDAISYVYIRVFAYSNTPVVGTVDWGTSLVYELSPTLGVASVDFNPGDDLGTGNTNNFVVVPEPSTGNLMILFFAMLGGIRARMKRRERDVRLAADPA